RRRVPVLLLDDEADQATPNSATARDQFTKINQLVRQIWAEIPTGTYLGYTATPFANIFMDPNDEEELYPADFIMDLPRPRAYFGAERVFGREPLDDADEPDPGLDMVRDVPDEDAEALKPPTKKEERATFVPELPGSLIDAVTWFLLATAIRRARGQRTAHSSMLLHTTHYVQPHFVMQDRLDDLTNEFRVDWEAGDRTSFLTSYEAEGTRAAEVATMPLPMWSDIEQELGRVLSDVRVVVDNGESEDRLDYDRFEDGDPVAETVIAVGGGTLSRGLTLEGLVVSYFTRTSNTYDTLLQMGRWFGYRPGYEDLPRIWMQPSLAEEFKFLSLIEEEIRQDMH
ncbi:MAG: Z1 domain-containing protein, partial [Thaumarchaeota archaeon]|nr:Z1 domain-containing protein [Nitrososphaerota archaeon]